MRFLIGQKIKERRTEISLSLRELGVLTSLSASFLSQIENDLTDPSISSLQKIARALKVPMFTFLNGREQPEQVVRHNARKQLSFPNPHVQFDLLTNDLNRQMAGFLIRLKSGESHHAQQLYKSTEEMMYVIEGQMDIKVGENTYRLDPGDSIYYEGSQLVLFTASGPDDLVTLCMITPPAF
ncbi:MAG: helix-turn-helix domain-containing protein [Chloroflexi bacterium]|nr:helix-turn-helix domain-containing protein [Chloroflexota bacterium]